jgi:hypothetical protein
LTLTGTKWREAGENWFAKYYYGTQIKESEMDGARSTDGRDEKYIQNFFMENLKGTDHVED